MDHDSKIISNAIARLTKDAPQVSESFLTTGLLTAAGGFLDTYSYLARGGVFANAQTGNIVLLGIQLINGSWTGCLRYLLPVAAFSGGVMISHAVRDGIRKSRQIHWRQCLILIEILLLTIASFLPRGWIPDTAANILISTVCAIQFSAFRKSSGYASATTFCTGNLRSGSDALYRYRKTGNREELRKMKNYFGLILSFFAGIPLGILSVRIANEKGLLFCLPVMTIAFLLMFIDKEKVTGSAVK
ncbi:MAG: YoaK family protein [Spirochaetia bacterium]|nr:YoaK family protein [Spirochaetia bacterium]